MKATISIVLYLAIVTHAFADSRISESSSGPLFLLVSSLIIALLVFTKKPKRITGHVLAVLVAAITYSLLYACTMVIIFQMNFIGLTSLFDLMARTFFNIIHIQIAFWALFSLPIYLLLENINKNTTTILVLIGSSIPVAILIFVSNSIVHQSIQLHADYKGIRRKVIEDGGFTLWGWLGFFEIAILLGCSGALTAILFRTIVTLYEKKLYK